MKEWFGAGLFTTFIILVVRADWQSYTGIAEFVMTFISSAFGVSGLYLIIDCIKGK